MGLYGAISHITLLILWINTTSLTAAEGETSVQAHSEGSDCRCKCILTTKDGGPCDDLGVARKTIYLVETISGGTDCRCTCHTPPPSGCEGISRPAESAQSSFPSRREVPDHEVDDIDLVELHKTISNMVSVMVKLEKAVSKTGANKGQALRRNTNKVVSDLKSTNGSYTDLLRDLELDTQELNEMEKDEDEEPTETTQYLPPASERPGDAEWPDKSDALQLDRLFYDIGVSPSPPSVSTFPVTTRTATATATKPEAARTTTGIEETTVASEDSTTTIQEESVLTSTNPHSLEPDNTSHTTQATITSTKVTSPSTVAKSVKHDRIVPRVLFKPYRAKKHHTPRAPRTQSPPKSVAEDYNYEYDEFDVVITKKSATTTRTTATKQQAERVVPPIAPVINANTTTRSTITAKESDDSYADYFDEYEYDYDDEDTTTTPTTAAATTAEIGGYDPCGTLVSISRPIEVGHFGRREGAWMRDPIPSNVDPNRTRRIYIANFYYGSNLLEFDGVEGIRNLRYLNSYNLPHKWIGTGHIVYNGSFYYNRAFSRTLIKYNLRYRFVSAWSRLANAIYEIKSTLTWKGHSMVHLAADEGGLWVIYPSYDPFDPHAKLNYMVNKINPVDLRVMESYKTKLRHPASHIFMVCGMLYTTDRYNSHRARVTHVFDTRTLAQRSFYLGFEHMFSYAVQFLYNPTERKIYAWDNGRQIEYNVGLIH